MHITTDIESLLPANIQAEFYGLTKINLGVSAPITFTLERGFLELFKLMFPNSSFQLKNKSYPCISTIDQHGKPFDLYWRRGIMDLIFRSLGVVLSKGYTVEVRNRNKSDLRISNLAPILTVQKHRKNDWRHHYIIGIRLNALFAGECPDKAMQDVILSNQLETVENKSIA